MCSSAVVVVATSRNNVGGKRKKVALRRMRVPFVVTNGGIEGKKRFRRDVVRFSATTAVKCIFKIGRPRI